MDEPKRLQEPSSESGWIWVLSVSAILGLAGLWGWKAFHIDPWAGRVARTLGADTEVGKFAAPGAFGDAFAPVVGFLTALALGAAVASANMQRKELQESRAQYKSQAQALDKANELASDANLFAQTAQILEAMKQLADYERLAIERIQTLKDRQANYPFVQGQRPFPIGDPGEVWLRYSAAWATDRAEAMSKYEEVDTIELRKIAQRKQDLSDILKKLQDALE